MYSIQRIETDCIEKWPQSTHASEVIRNKMEPIYFHASPEFVELLESYGNLFPEEFAGCPMRRILQLFD